MSTAEATAGQGWYLVPDDDEGECLLSRTRIYSQKRWEFTLAARAMDSGSRSVLLYDYRS
jgi:hypothetical protein